MRVLQIEDDLGVAKAAELMLAADGHSCETAANGEEALRLAVEKDYDLILLDLMLPDMSGYEVINRLSEAQVKTRVLIQTGLADKGDHRAGLGVPDCLVKPLNRQDHSPAMEATTARDEPENAIQPSDTCDDEAERRAAPRTKSLKSGQIVYNHQRCVIDCLVLGLSQGGATLKPADMLNFPDCFQLRFQDGSSYDCEICWQSGDKLGVRFLAA